MSRYIIPFHHYLRFPNNSTLASIKCHFEIMNNGETIRWMNSGGVSASAQHNMQLTPWDANNLSSPVSSRLSATQLNRTEQQPFEMNTQTHNSLNSLWMNDYINFHHFSSFSSLVPSYCTAFGSAAMYPPPHTLALCTFINFILFIYVQK